MDNTRTFDDSSQLVIRNLHSRLSIIEQHVRDQNYQQANRLWNGCARSLNALHHFISTANYFARSGGVQGASKGTNTKKKSGGSKRGFLPQQMNRSQQGYGERNNVISLSSEDLNRISNRVTEEVVQRLERAA